MSESPLSRPIQAAKDVSNTVSQAVKSRISILSDGKTCPECGSEMDATQAFDAKVGAFYAGNDGYRPAWVCEECGVKLRREDDSPSFDPYG